MKKKLTLNLLVLISITLIISSCKKPFDNINIVVTPQVIQYTALLKIVDAADGSEPTGTTVSFSGSNAKRIYDLAGKKAFTVNSGYVSFGLDPAIKPSVNNAISVNVMISAPGYLTISKLASFTAGETEQSLQVQLTKISAPANGVSVAVQSYPLVNNTLAKDISFATPLTANKQEYTAVGVSAGTKFRDKDGNAISAGTLNVQSVHFDTRNESSLSAFPGGLSQDAVKLQDGTQAAGTFITAGFSSIDFKQGSTVVKNFDQPVKITITADPQLINPETQQPIQDGDLIPVWSYSPEDGLWKYETTAAFKNDNGALRVDFNTTHLTWYNLAWYNKTCSATKSFKIAGASDLRDTYVIQLFSRNSTRALQTSYVYGIVDSSFVLHNIPDMDLKLRIYRASEFNAQAYYTGTGTQTTNFTETNYINLCSSGGTINFPGDIRQTISFELVGVCTQKNVELRPSGYVYYRDISAGTAGVKFKSAYISIGKFVTKDLAIGHTYEVVSYYGSSSFSFTKKLQYTEYHERINLKGNYCDGF